MQEAAVDGVIQGVNHPCKSNRGCHMRCPIPLAMQVIQRVDILQYDFHKVYFDGGVLHLAGDAFLRLSLFEPTPAKDYRCLSAKRNRYSDFGSNGAEERILQGRRFEFLNTPLHQRLPLPSSHIGPNKDFAAIFSTSQGHNR